MRSKIQDVFGSIAHAVSIATGSVWAFSIAVLVLVVWAVTGPIFGFSDAWQLVINTGTTIVTFLMVFVIQHAQNKEMRALQIKLDELIAVTVGASNKLIDVEDLSDAEVDRLYHRFQSIARRVAQLPRGARLSADDDDASGETPT